MKTLAQHFADNVSTTDIMQLSLSAIESARELLNASAQGTPLKQVDTKNLLQLAERVAHVAQTLEDGIVKAGLTPDHPEKLAAALNQAYHKAPGL